MSRLTKFIESVIKLVEIDPKIYQFNQVFPLVGKAFPVIVSRNKPAIQQGIIWIDINNSSNSYRKALVCDGSEFIIANKYDELFQYPIDYTITKQAIGEKGDQGDKGDTLPDKTYIPEIIEHLEYYKGSLEIRGSDTVESRQNSKYRVYLTAYVPYEFEGEYFSKQQTVEIDTQIISTPCYEKSIQIHNNSLFVTNDLKEDTYVNLYASYFYGGLLISTNKKVLCRYVPPLPVKMEIITGTTQIKSGTSESISFKVTFEDGSTELKSLSEITASTDNGNAVLETKEGKDYISVKPEIFTAFSFKVTASYSQNGVTVKAEKSFTTLSDDVLPETLTIECPNSATGGDSFTIKYLLTYNNGKSEYVNATASANYLEINGNTAYVERTAPSTTTTITANYAGLTATKQINITKLPLPQSINIITEDTISSGQTRVISYQLVYDTGKIENLSGTDVNITSNNPKVTITTNNTRLVGDATLPNGTCVLTASLKTDNTIKGTKTIQCIKNFLQPLELIITCADSMSSGSSYPIKFSLRLDDNSTQDLQPNQVKVTLDTVGVTYSNGTITVANYVPNGTCTIKAVYTDTLFGQFNAQKSVTIVHIAVVTNFRMTLEKDVMTQNSSQKVKFEILADNSWVEIQQSQLASINLGSTPSDYATITNGILTFSPTIPIGTVVTINASYSQNANVYTDSKTVRCNKVPVELSFELPDVINNTLTGTFSTSIYAKVKYSDNTETRVSWSDLSHIVTTSNVTMNTQNSKITASDIDKDANWSIEADYTYNGVTIHGKLLARLKVNPFENIEITIDASAQSVGSAVSRVTITGNTNVTFKSGISPIPTLTYNWVAYTSEGGSELGTGQSVNAVLENVIGTATATCYLKYYYTLSSLSIKVFKQAQTTVTLG